MRIEDYDALVACERSGIVRDALERAGVRAVSCDLFPTQRPGPHYQGDVREILPLRHWRLLIAHPVCKYLTNACAKHLYRRVNGVWSIKHGPDEDRWQKMREGAAFFLQFEQADHIPMRAVENPIMHGHAIAIIGRKPDQYIQPWMFGDPFSKATGLHLTRLPKLVAEKRKSDYAPGEIKQKVWLMPPSEDREEKRSETEPGIARAFAEQWGPLVTALRRAA
jgi:hypothetical protein